MQFVLIDACGGLRLGEGFFFALWCSPLVMLSLLTWLRKGARDARDVLAPTAPLPRSLVPAFRDHLSWVCTAAAFIGPLLLGMAFLIKADGVFLDHFDDVLVGVEPNSWGWFAAMTLLFGLLRVRWLRSSPTRRDVLDLGARTA